MVLNSIKIFHKMKNKSLLVIGKNVREWEKAVVIIIRKLVLKNEFWSYKFKFKNVEIMIKKSMKKLKPYIKIDQKSIHFDDTEIEE